MIDVTSNAHTYRHRTATRGREVRPRAAKGPASIKRVTVLLAIGTILLVGGASFAATHHRASRTVSASTSRGLSAAARRSPSRSAITYTVKPGDTLSAIAVWFRTHGYGSLYAADKAVIGSHPGRIFPGEQIRIANGVMRLSGRPSDGPGE